MSEKPGTGSWEDMRTKLRVLKASQESEGKGNLCVLPDTRWQGNQE